MREARRRQYLEAMGITLWERRDLPQPAEPMNVKHPSEERGLLPPERDAQDGGERRPSPASKDRSSPDPSSRPHSPPAETSPPPWEMEEPPPYDEPPPDWEPMALPGEEEVVIDRSVAGLDWDGLRQRVKNCRLCGLRQGCTQTVFGVGDTSADLLVIGEAPGADEDRQGEPFVGRAGQLLNEMLLAMGFKREQVFIANILKCRPPNNRDPKPEEALKCEPFLLRQIELIRPRAILSVGRISAQNLLKTDIAVGRLRGRVHNYGEKGIPLVVTYHPAYLLRSSEQKGKAWDDLQLALSLLRGERS